MRRWKQRALSAEAEVAALESAGEASADTIYGMVEDAEERADAFYRALEQVREVDHGHPRDAAGVRVSAVRCEVCCIVAEAGL